MDVKPFDLLITFLVLSLMISSYVKLSGDFLQKAKNIDVVLSARDALVRDLIDQTSCGYRCDTLLPSDYKNTPIINSRITFSIGDPSHQIPFFLSKPVYNDIVSPWVSMRCEPENQKIVTKTCQWSNNEK